MNDQDFNGQTPEIRVTDERSSSREFSPEFDPARSRTSSESTTPYCTDSDEEYKSRQESKKMRSKLRSLTLDKLEASDLEERIISQAEFYFSDENLKKDGFLLKHVKRNKEGFVNLKLLSSFKKMRSLSKDFKVVANALRNSTKLLVNEEGTKVKRLTPLPKSLCEQVPVRFVVVSKIPDENPSMEYISDAFPDKEQLVSIRIIRPGKKYPNDLQAHFAHHPDLVNETVAVVEFENSDQASDVSALDLSNSQTHKGLQLTLLELGPRQGAKKNKTPSVDSTEESDHATLDAGNSSAGSKSPKNVRAKNKNTKRPNRVRELAVSGDESCSYASSSDNENTFVHFKSCQRRYRSGSQNSTPGSSPQTSPVMHRKKDARNTREGKNSNHTSPQATPSSGRKGDVTPPRSRNDNASPASSPQGSPWPSRRGELTRSGKKNDHRLSPLALGSPHSSPEMPGKQYGKLVVETGHSPNSPWITKRLDLIKDMNDNHLNSKLNDFGLIRQPRGPDGSRGFQNHPLRNS